MRIMYGSPDVCSSDLPPPLRGGPPPRSGEELERPLPVESRLNQSRQRTRRIGIFAEPHAPRQIGVAPRLDRALHSSEESRVGQECVCTCRSRWSPYL